MEQLGHRYFRWLSALSNLYGRSNRVYSLPIQFASRRVVHIRFLVPFFSANHSSEMRAPSWLTQKRQCSTTSLHHNALPTRCRNMGTPSMRHTWPLSRVLSVRALIRWRIRCQMLLFAQKLGIPTLDVAQAVQRLLHLARVLHHGLDWLWSLIQSQAGKQWRECVFLDLEFMAADLHSILADFGDPRGHRQTWQAFILGFPGVWMRLVRSFSAIARSPRRHVPSPTVSWPCYECVKTYKSSKALASHQARSHHKERLSGQLQQLSFLWCLLCSQACHVIMLISGSKTCKARLLSSPDLSELTEEEVALARQRDRLDYAFTKAQGVWNNAGPPACPPAGGWTRPKHSSCRDEASSSVD